MSLPQTSSATILSSLLAILEPGTTEDAKEASNNAKPLIIVIDEFDLFAHHSVRQSFLYCLLDCVQGGFRRGGMAVLGISARAVCSLSLKTICIADDHVDTRRTALRLWKNASRVVARVESITSYLLKMSSQTPSRWPSGQCCRLRTQKWTQIWFTTGTPALPCVKESATRPNLT